MQTNGIDKAYYVEAEGEITTILSNFNTSFIYNVVEDLMKDRYTTFNLIPKPNFVDSLEISFKDLISSYPGDAENAKLRRTAVYKEIIERISNNTGVTIYYDEYTDLYSLARNVFDLFVSNYDGFVFKFLYNFIYSQREFIYNSLDFEKIKKSKDISTSYNKMTYSDQTMAIINANLDLCLGFITALDFNAPTTLSYMYTSGTEIHTMNFLLNHIDQEADLFDILIKPIITNETLYPLVSTALKLEIQKNNVTIIDSYQSNQ